MKATPISLPTITGGSRSRRKGSSSQAVFTPSDFVQSLQLQSSEKALRANETSGVNKTILLQACVVDDSKSKLKYEGIFLSINSIDYFSYLTYSEMEFLIYELRKVDFNSLTMQLINTHMISDSIESEKLKLPEKPPLVENKSEEIIDNKTRIGLPKPNTIPEI